MLMLPKAQLWNMLTSPTPDLTVAEMHGRAPKASSAYFQSAVYSWNMLGYGIGICGYIWMMVWIHCKHQLIIAWLHCKRQSTRGRHVRVVVFILVAWIQSGTAAVKWTKCVLMGVSSWQSHTQISPAPFQDTAHFQQAGAVKYPLCTVCVWTGPHKPQRCLSACLYPARCTILHTSTVFPELLLKTVHSERG